MPEAKEIVINTGPLLALIAAWGRLDYLNTLYRRVWVPHEVSMEIERGGNSGFGVAEFKAAEFLHRLDNDAALTPLLRNSLDRGEAAVIHLAIEKGIDTVCIDETVGRRIARLSGLELTGSIGILARSYHQGCEFSMEDAVQRMLSRGIRLSKRVVEFA